MPSGRTTDGAQDHVSSVANDLVQERPANQFTTLVEFDVLTGASEIDRLALAHERKRLDAGRHLGAGAVGDVDDLLGEVDRICRFGFLDRGREDVDGVELKRGEWKHGAVRRTHRLDERL